jgi:hypothetical protein
MGLDAMADWLARRFEVLTAVRMTMLLFWVVSPCRLVSRYQHFEETYCLYLQG